MTVTVSANSRQACCKKHAAVSLCAVLLFHLAAVAGSNAQSNVPMFVISKATGRVLIQRSREFLPADRVPAELRENDVVVVEDGSAEVRFRRKGRFVLGAHSLAYFRERGNRWEVCLLYGSVEWVSTGTDKESLVLPHAVVEKASPSLRVALECKADQCQIEVKDGKARLTSGGFSLSATLEKGRAIRLERAIRGLSFMNLRRSSGVVSVKVGQKTAVAPPEGFMGSQPLCSPATPLSTGLQPGEGVLLKRVSEPTKKDIGWLALGARR